MAPPETGPLIARLRLRWRWPAFAAALLATWSLAGFLLVPALLRSAMESYARDTLHRPFSVGIIRFNPFTFMLEIHELDLRRARDEGPLLSFRLLRVDAEPMASLLHRAWTVQELRLEQPRIEAYIDEQGELNLASLLPPSPPQPQPTAPAAPPSIRIGTLAVVDGRASLDDRSGNRRVQMQLTPIGFTLHDFRTTFGHESAYRLEATSSAGERLTWSGQFTVAPLGSSGQFELAGIRTATLAQFLGDALPVALRGGTLDLQGRYQAAYSHDLALTLQMPTLAIHDLGVLPAGSTDTNPWVQLPLLELRDTSLSLAERRVRIGQVRLDGTQVRAWREPDGSINLDRLAAGTAAPAAPATSDATATVKHDVQPATEAPWALAVDDIRISGAQVDFADRSLSPAGTLRLAPVNVAVQGYALAGNHPVSFDVDIGLDGRGQFKAQGSAMLEPLQGDAQLAINGLALAQLQPWLATTTQLAINDGLLRLQGHADLRTGKHPTTPVIAFKGAVGIDRLATQDTVARAPLVAWKQLDVSGIDYRSSPQRLRVDTVRIRGADARVAIAADGSLNVARALAAPGTAAAAPASPSVDQSAEDEAAEEIALAAAIQSSPAPAAQVAGREQDAGREADTSAASSRQAGGMPLSIRRVLVEDANVNFSDQAVQPAFSATILGLSGSVTGLSSEPASHAQVDLAGSLDRYAPVRIAGELNLLAADVFSDITMKFSNIELTTFNPYSGKFAGYNIAKGKLSTELVYRVERRKLNAQHHVVLDQMEFGAATQSKDAVPLPVRLAVALLKDRNGVIDLQLPVTGSLDDPRFRIAPIVWKMLRGLVRKVVTAPFALLGSLFGGGPDLQNVQFAPGSAELADAERARLAQLAKALAERPQLKLDVPLETLCPEDTPALDAAAFETAVAAALPATAAGQPAPARLALLKALYQKQFGTQPSYPAEEAADKADAKGGDAKSSELQQQWLEAQLRPRYTAGENGRSALARARAEAVRDAVLGDGTLDAARVFLTTRNSGSSPAGAARMVLQLQ